MNKTTRPAKTMTEIQLITRAKEYAEKNYDNGMDTLVECYDNDEWRKLVQRIDAPGELLTWAEVKRIMDSIAGIYRDRQAEAAYQRRAAIGDDSILTGMERHDCPKEETVQRVKDCPEVETMMRQVLKDTYGQAYLFEMHLEMPVTEAREYIHHLQHLND